MLEGWIQYVLTAFGGLVILVAGYWASRFDARLTRLEQELEREKLQSSARLTRLEAILERMSKQLDHIERELSRRDR